MKPRNKAPFYADEKSVHDRWLPRLREIFDGSYVPDAYPAEYVYSGLHGTALLVRLATPYNDGTVIRVDIGNVPGRGFCAVPIFIDSRRHKTDFKVDHLPKKMVQRERVDQNGWRIPIDSEEAIVDAIVRALSREDVLKTIASFLDREEKEHKRRVTEEEDARLVSLLADDEMVKSLKGTHNVYHAFESKDKRTRVSTFRNSDGHVCVMATVDARAPRFMRILSKVLEAVREDEEENPDE